MDIIYCRYFVRPTARSILRESEIPFATTASFQIQEITGRDAKRRENIYLFRGLLCSSISQCSRARARVKNERTKIQICATARDIVYWPIIIHRYRTWLSHVARKSTGRNGERCSFAKRLSTRDVIRVDYHRHRLPRRIRKERKKNNRVK